MHIRIIHIMRTDFLWILYTIFRVRRDRDDYDNYPCTKVRWNIWGIRWKSHTWSNSPPKDKVCGPAKQNSVSYTLMFITKQVYWEILIHNIISHVSHGFFSHKKKQWWGNFYSYVEPEGQFTAMLTPYVTKFI